MPAPSSRLKVLFFGSPGMAVPYLEALTSEHEVVGVVTQPDKPAGRGLKSTAPPVKVRAEELGLKVFSPEKLSTVARGLKALAPDISVMVAYGRLIKADILSVPRLGTINVHFSLLPRYRGAAPVQWALVRGETRTGVTVFWVDEGMDTGPIFMKRALDIGPDEDAPALFERLIVLGVAALEETLAEIGAGRLVRETQAGEATRAPLIRREQGRLDFDLPAAELHNLVRGMRQWPRAFFDTAAAQEPRSPSHSFRSLEGTVPQSGTERGSSPSAKGASAKRVLVLKTALPGDAPRSSAGGPGSIVLVERETGILVECGASSFLWLVLVQPEGKKPTPAADYLNGLRLKAGDRLPIYALGRN